ncbi:MAG: hypothetical protein US42_C0015G0006 [Candidatus Magasanikbacteria bacterium GW2011_GWC2_37_14]|uniref:PEP-utilising enzyme mobile domain-containing protein n=1 Tax=Candidatus Magasanikbacteria bacterium GW2011_GWC2_37_14 TaxID=1619046 RepID=A0A0G0G7H0_9BACT|nr:MAG: hypothetical protein US42_C0015G0006 [Candidatus Magasanikbacteria bacterium GW2011_GWC2_37_14]
MKITEIIDSKMPSITEWLEKTGMPNIQEFRQEDNNKRDRLEILNQTIGINYDKPIKLLATDISQNTEKFQQILKENGNDKCALRLSPIVKDLPKLRVRGKTLIQNLEWFKNLDINPEDYKAEIIPHNDNTSFSGIILINDLGIFGEIVPGPHWQLTQGFFENKPLIFSYKNDLWHFSYIEPTIQKVLTSVLESLKVENLELQKELTEKLAAKFNEDQQLKGYFEFVVWPPDNNISFIDYNRVLYEKLKNSDYSWNDPGSKLAGIPASPGKAQGIVKIINDPTKDSLTTDNIIVCDMTTVEYLPLMAKAAGIITKQGNILCHAAIAARELGKPCIVQVGNKISELKNDDKILMNGTTGLIEKITP